MNINQKTKLSILFLCCIILSKSSIHVTSHAFAKNVSTNATSSTETSDALVVQDYSGDTFTLQLDKKYTNVKLSFIELADGSISDANVRITNTTVSVAMLTMFLWALLPH